MRYLRPAAMLKAEKTLGTRLHGYLHRKNMADDRSPRRRKRTFSTTSTISTDDYQDASEQIVEDITLEFFYKPRSITALACLFAYLVYSAFTRWAQDQILGFQVYSCLFAFPFSELDRFFLSKKYQYNLRKRDYFLK